MALGNLGSLLGGNSQEAQSLSSMTYQQYANGALIQQAYNRQPLPEGWGFTDYNAVAIPLTFLAKLRHEISEWHNDPLERTK